MLTSFFSLTPFPSSGYSQDMKLPTSLTYSRRGQQAGALPLLSLLGLTFLVIGIVITIKLIEQGNIDIRSKAAEPSPSDTSTHLDPAFKQKTFTDLLH